jgi:diguanylate cyclase (GGDEF)-like protein/PAS domain S-box-containing protein
MTQDGPDAGPKNWLEIARSALMTGQTPAGWPAEDNEDSGWRALVEDLIALRGFVRRLSGGDLSSELKVRGQLAGSLKSLQASLRHLTWQVEQVANGDLTQKVDFMGDFSTAFNQMTENLHQARQSLQASEERYRLLAENAKDVIWIMSLDGRFTYISPSVEALRGFTVEEVLGQTIDQALTPDSAALVRESLAESIDRMSQGERIPSGRYELEQSCKDGSTVWTEVVAEGLYDDQERFIGILGVTRDISERRLAQMAEREQRDLAEALRDTAAALNSALRLEEVLDVILAGMERVVHHDAVEILLIDPGAASPATRQAYAVRVAGLEPSAAILCLEIETTPNLRTMSETHQHLLIDDLHQYDWIDNPATRFARSYLGIPILIKEQVAGFLALFSATPGFFTIDHSTRMKIFADQAAVAIEKARLFEQLNLLATIDALTGIANRRHFMQLATFEFARAMRYGKPLAACMIDIDYFKRINDTCGHLAGDQVLHKVAQICTGCLRQVDLIGRYGGEEFALLLPETSVQGAQALAERLRACVADQTSEDAEACMPVTISIGVAALQAEHAEESVPGAASLTELLNLADQALYAAKHHGRNRVEIAQ